MRCGGAAAACASSAAAAAANPAPATDAAHRSPRRDRGAPAAAVRARIRVRAHLRWSWCTLAEKRDEIAKACGSGLVEFRPCRPRYPAEAVPGPVPYSRFVTYGRRNMRPAFSIAIDRFGVSCTIPRPDRI